MSLEFIKKGVNKSSIHEARKQQEQLLYFTKSEIQDDITIEYLEEWFKKKYATNDYFYNWIKTILKTDNFLSVYKYSRNPMPSAGLINDKVKPALERVLYAEDSYFNYTINNELFTDLPDLKNDLHTKEFLNNILFRTNDIYITDVKTFNDSYCYLVSINDVVSLEHNDHDITKLAFSAVVKNDEGKDILGTAYIDETKYSFYDTDDNLIKESYHDLERCPAVFVGCKTLNDDFVVKENKFSYLRYELEEYVITKTLQRISEMNGAFPVIVSLETNEKTRDGIDSKGVNSQQPLSANLISGQSSELKSEVTPHGSPNQAGSVIKIKPEEISDGEGKINVDVLKNFITHFNAPVKILKYIDDRVKEMEIRIVSTAIGTHVENSQEGSKSDLHIGKTYVSMEDRLRSLSQELSILRNRMDLDRLGMRYGKDNVTVDGFFGSKFFMETQADLYKLYDLAPNALERKNIVVKSIRNKNRFNPTKAEKDTLMYEFLPYASDKDFDLAINRGLVSDNDFELQTRFSYYIGKFEANFGDIYLFYLSMGDLPKVEKIKIINDMLLSLINKNK